MEIEKGAIASTNIGSLELPHISYYIKWDAQNGSRCYEWFITQEERDTFYKDFICMN